MQISSLERRHKQYCYDDDVLRAIFTQKNYHFPSGTRTEKNRKIAKTRKIAHSIITTINSIVITINSIIITINSIIITINSIIITIKRRIVSMLRIFGEKRSKS